MKCVWQSFIELLPKWMREFVDKQGKDTLQELRLRVNSPPILKFQDRMLKMNRTVDAEDLKFCINMVTQYSPWSVSSAAQCFYTAPGGHRIGVCGNVTTENGQPKCIHYLSSLCIRIARDFSGIARELTELTGAVLIVGRPGSGKTTLLRDLIRQLSNNHLVDITVVDERSEIFPYHNGRFCFEPGVCTDVISGCSKAFAIEAAIRNNGPRVIAVDEITATTDCNALLQAGWCGVNLIATAHASSVNDLKTRNIYKPIIESGLFDHFVILHNDKSWHIEGVA